MMDESLRRILHIDAAHEIYSINSAIYGLKTRSITHLLKTAVEYTACLEMSILRTTLESIHAREAGLWRL